MSGKKTRVHGVTLIEAVLFISIALALIVGGLVFYQQASLAMRTAAVVRYTQAVVVESRALVRQEKSLQPTATSWPADSLHEVLAARGSLPPFPAGLTGDQIRVKLGSFGPGGDYGRAIPPEEFTSKTCGATVLSVMFDGIPVKMCTRIAVTDEHFNGVLGGDLVGVHIRGFLNLPPSYPLEYRDLHAPITPAEAAEFCSASLRDNTLLIEFLFMLYGGDNMDPATKAEHAGCPVP